MWPILATERCPKGFSNKEFPILQNGENNNNGKNGVDWRGLARDEKDNNGKNGKNARRTIDNDPSCLFGVFGL